MTNQVVRVPVKEEPEERKASTQGNPFRKTESRFNTNDYTRSVSFNRSPEPEVADGKQTYMLGNS